MARLVALGQYDDGFIDTPNIDGSIDSQDYGARLGLRSQPADRLTVDLSGSFDRSEYRAFSNATLDSIEGDGDLKLLINTDGDNRLDRSIIDFRGAYDSDVGTLISNTAYVRVKSNSDGDGDFTEIDGLFRTAEFKEGFVSQEFRFDSERFSAPFLGETGFLSGVNTTLRTCGLGCAPSALTSRPSSKTYSMRRTRPAQPRDPALYPFSVCPSRSRWVRPAASAFVAVPGGVWSGASSPVRSPLPISALNAAS
ncbi:MAG: hypothetical protein MI785_25785 [Kiloniellales bacterium]|nr:hypothetical protein [Kiloniellales bacterium]